MEIDSSYTITKSSSIPNMEKKTYLSALEERNKNEL